MKTFSFEDVMSIIQERKEILDFFNEYELNFILRDLDSNSDNYTKNLFYWNELDNIYKQFIKNKIIASSTLGRIKNSLLNKFMKKHFLVYKIIKPDYNEFIVLNKDTLKVNYENHTNDLNISCIKIRDYKDSVSIKKNTKVSYKSLHFLASSIRTYNKEEYNEFIAELTDFEK